MSIKLESLSKNFQDFGDLLDDKELKGMQEMIQEYENVDRLESLFPQDLGDMPKLKIVDSILVDGMEDKLMSLSDVFLPSISNPIRTKMQFFNRVTSIKDEKEQEMVAEGYLKKREVKARMKKRLADRTKLQRPHLEAINYLKTESVTQKAMEMIMEKQRYLGQEHIEKTSLSNRQSSEVTPEESFSFLGKRKHPRQSFLEGAEDKPLKKLKLEPVISEEQKRSSLPTSVFQDSMATFRLDLMEGLAIFQQAQITNSKKDLRAANLSLMESSELVSKKISAVRKKAAKEQGASSILEQLTAHEKSIWLLSFQTSYYTSMRDLHPALQSLSSTEKSCFEFVSKLDFELFKQIGDFMKSGQERGGWLNYQEVKDTPLEQTALGPFFGGRAPAEEQKEVFAADTANLKLTTPFSAAPQSSKERASPSLEEPAADLSMCASSSDESFFSDNKSMRSGPSSEEFRPMLDEFASIFQTEERKEVDGKDEVELNSSQTFKTGSGSGVFEYTPLADGDSQQPKALTAYRIELLPSYYKELERDQLIRDQLATFQASKLQELNCAFIQLQRRRGYDLRPVARKKYWGELVDCDSQAQMDKDFVDLKKHELFLPDKLIREKKPFRVLERKKKTPSAPFKEVELNEFETKYGTLNLFAARPNDDYIVEDMKEYEFVMKQRAYLYDPNYLKGCDQYDQMAIEANKFLDKEPIHKLREQQKAAQKQVEVDQEQDENSTLPKANLVTSKNPLELLLCEFTSGVAVEERVSKKKLHKAASGSSSFKAMSEEEKVQLFPDNYDSVQTALQIQKLNAFIKSRTDQCVINLMKKKATDQVVPYKPALGEHYMGKDASKSAAKEKEELSMPEEQIPQKDELLLKQLCSSKGFEVSQETRSLIHLMSLDELDLDIIKAYGNNYAKRSHPKIILDLTFTKFRIRVDADREHLHRPCIMHYFEDAQKENALKVPADKGRQPKLKISVFEDGDYASSTGGNPLQPSTDYAFTLAKLPLSVMNFHYLKRRHQHGVVDASSYFRDRYRLSLKDGKFCLFEHSDENPLFINNFGMVSQLTRHIYHHEGKVSPLHEFLVRPSFRHMGPFGYQKLMSKDQRLELIGNVDRRHYSGISILSNKMYNAPVYFSPYKASERADFFCSIHLNKVGQRQVVLREVKNTYVVGQIEPIIEVYHPSSRDYYDKHIRKRVQAFTMRFLKENQNKISFKELNDLFIGLPELRLKQFLKEADIDTVNGVSSYSRPFSEGTFQNLLPPEQSCSLESSLRGETKLRKAGILNIVNPDKISMVSNRYTFIHRDDEWFPVARYIEDEILSSPWSIAFNYLDIRSRDHMFKLEGVGDPSNGHGGFSFLKLPFKVTEESLQDSMRVKKELNPALFNPRLIEGTEADLRKMTKEQAESKLLEEHSFAQWRLDEMTRWEMIGVIRTKQPHLENQDEKFSRGIRNNHKAQKSKYQAEVDRIFKIAMDNLTGNVQHGDDSDSSEPTYMRMKNFKRRYHFLVETPTERPTDDDELVVEITDPTDISKIMEPKEKQSEDEISFGSIKKLTDIPRWKRLLLFKIPQQSAITQDPDKLQEKKKAKNFHQLETAVESMLEEKKLSSECMVLCQIVKNLEDPSITEKIIFQTDEREFEKFFVRLKKCQNRDRNRKISLRLRMKDVEDQYALMNERDKGFLDDAKMLASEDEAAKQASQAHGAILPSKSLEEQKEDEEMMQIDIDELLSGARPTQSRIVLPPLSEEELRAYDSRGVVTDWSERPDMTSQVSNMFDDPSEFLQEPTASSTFPATATSAATFTESEEDKPMQAGDLLFAVEKASAPGKKNEKKSVRFAEDKKIKLVEESQNNQKNAKVSMRNGTASGEIQKNPKSKAKFTEEDFSGLQIDVDALNQDLDLTQQHLDLDEYSEFFNPPDF